MYMYVYTFRNISMDGIFYVHFADQTKTLHIESRFDSLYKDHERLDGQNVRPRC